MTWLILALICVVSVSIATILERVLLKDDDSDPIAYAIVFQLIIGIMILGVTLILNKFVFPSLNLTTYIRFFVSTILWAGSTVLGFQAIKRITATEVTILASSGTVVSIMLSVLFLKEVISFKLIFGTILVLVSVYIINSEKLTFKSRQGIVFALLSALCGGIAVVNDVIILQTYEVFSYVSIMALSPGIVLMIFFPKKLIKTKALIFSKTFKLMLIFSFFYAIQAVTYYLSYQSGAPLSKLAPITKSSIILTVLLGIIFLHERKDLSKKIIATILVTTGVILIG